MPTKPFVRRFGQVDFDSMIDIGAANDADIFVMRRGAFGSNRIMTRAAIIAGAGSVPDPLLLNDGVVGAPTYSFTNSPTSGVYRPAADVLGYTLDGTERWRMSADLFRSGIAFGPTLQNINGVAGVANINPRQDDLDTGLGSSGSDIMTFIAGGVEVAKCREIGGIVQLQFPIQNDASNPSIAIGGTDSGFFASSANNIKIAISNAAQWHWVGTLFQGENANGPLMINRAPTAILPNIIVDKANAGTGLGAATANQLNLIADGLTCMSIRNNTGARKIAFYDGSPILLQTGVAVTTAAIHAALVNLRLFTA